MTKLVFVKADGTEIAVEAQNGSTVMQTALDNGIEEIVADCGGSCSCATCHCYIDEAWQNKLSAPDDIEVDMLDCVLERKASSRLSCQIEISDELDGLRIALPEAQF